MKVTTAIILAAGKGTRLRPLTDTRPKVLMPIAGKPLLQYNIERAAECGMRRVIIVVGEEEQAIRAAFGNGSQLGVEIAYVRQWEPLGTTHAMRCALPLLDGDPFVVTFGDNMTPFSLVDLVDRHSEEGHVATLCLKRAADPTKHGVVELDGHHVIGLEEKPEQPKTDLTMAGMYVFEPPVLEAAGRTRMSDKGEYYLPDTIQLLIGEGHDVGFVECTDWRTNVNTAEEMLQTNRMVMDAEHADGGGRLCAGTAQPNFIADTAEVAPDARIGPYVCLGQGTRVEADVEIRNCILFDGVEVGAGARLCNGIFGEGCCLAPGFRTQDDGVARIYAADGERLG